MPYFNVSVALRALSWKIRCYHVTRRACLKSNSIEAHEGLRQRQGKLTSTWANTICTFWSVLLNFLAVCQFVLAKVVSRPSSHTYECVGGTQTFQNIHWKRLGAPKVRRMGPTFGKSLTMCCVCNFPFSRARIEHAWN